MKSYCRKYTKILLKTSCFYIPKSIFISRFLEIIKKIDTQSLYFHIFEARIRLERADNDFSYWFGMELGENELAQRIAQIDPYTITLEGLRKKIVNLIEERLHA